MAIDWSKEEVQPPPIADILHLLQQEAVLVGSAVSKDYRQTKDLDVVLSPKALRRLVRAGHGYWIVRLGKNAFNLTALYPDGKEASLDLFRGCTLDCQDAAKNARRLSYEDALLRPHTTRLIEGIPICALAD